MEYEIEDDPQGKEEVSEGDRDGGIVSKHRALRSQSDVQPDEYPVKRRKDQRLTEIQAGND